MSCHVISVSYIAFMILLTFTFSTQMMTVFLIISLSVSSSDLQCDRNSLATFPYISLPREPILEGSACRIETGQQFWHHKYIYN